jgi:hypothetical protein
MKKSILIESLIKKSSRLIVFNAVRACALISIGVFCSCNSQTNQPPSKAPVVVETPVAPPAIEIKLNHHVNNYARLIAGLDTGSYINNETYLKFRSASNKAFEEFRANKLAPIETWRNTEISDTVYNSTTVLYPFSGPDIIYAYTVFPEALEYNLFGLEPIGQIPDWTEINQDSLISKLFGIQSALSDQMKLSFFITKRMASSMNKQDVDGVLPVLLFYMARLDLFVQQVKPIMLNDEGLVTECSPKNAVGLQIEFLHPGEQVIRKLNYFSLDISNKGFENYAALGNFIQSLQSTSTLIKSASYCLHEDKYSVIRKNVLDVSRSIVQDDTGIPYSFFQNATWSSRLFGEYTHPIAVFKQFFQAEYAKQFKLSATPINFRFGYSDPSSILVARKNAS